MTTSVQNYLTELNQVTANPVTYTPAPAMKVGVGQDPAYLAFQRAAGFENASDLANTAFEDQVTRRQALRASEGVQRDHADNAYNTQGQFSARGLNRSGMHKRAQMLIAERAGAALSGINADAAERIARLQHQATRNVGSRAHSLEQQAAASAMRMAEMGIAG